jgi:thiosulfate dehydrogenase [quinone] large subunit
MVQDPKTGDPVIVIHTSGSSYYAYDAVCTHAGCTVQYDPSQKMIVCPCHGGTFDPAHGAQVVAGPPPTPLAPVEMKITGDGSIYIV